MDAEKIGERLVRLRSEHLPRLSQARLAGLSGVDPTTISRIELGKVDPDLDTLKRLAAGLGVEVSELVGVALIDESRVEKDAAYPSLQEFLDELGGRVSAPEREWLMSQRFADGDPGDPGWWESQLQSYRKLKKKRAMGARNEVDTVAQADARRVLHVGTPEYDAAVAEIESWGHTVKPRAAITRTPAGYVLAGKPLERPFTQGSYKRSTLLKSGDSLDLVIIHPGTKEYRALIVELKRHEPGIAKLLEKSKQPVTRFPGGIRVGTKSITFPAA